MHTPNDVSTTKSKTKSSAQNPACDSNHYLQKLRKEELEEQICELAAHINAANYRLLMLIAEFDACEGWEGWGNRSCAHWLNWRCGIAMGAAREKVRCARALQDLPNISAAFAAGQLSYSKVRALTRIADPHNEDYLLMIAEHGSASHVEQLVRQYRSVLRNEQLEQEPGLRHANRSLNVYWDDNGYLVVKARLSPEQGAVLIKALQAAEEALEEDGQHVPAGTLLADDEPEDGLANTMTNTTIKTTINTTINTTATPFEQKRADAAVLIAETFLHTGPKATKTADRFQVVLHVSDSSLSRPHSPHAPQNQHDQQNQQCRLESGPALPSETARRLCCDSSVVMGANHAHGNEEEEEHKHGRKSRVIPPAMRRALQQRDTCCQFPGCSANRYVDGHHIQHWADGGATKLNNLVLLCRHHHHKVHEGGFTLRRTSAGQLQFARPDGQVIPPAPPLPRSNRELAQLNAQNGLEIGPQTGFSWQGDTLDLPMAIDGLVQHRLH